MPTQDRDRALAPQDVRERVAAVGFPRGDSRTAGDRTARDRIGLEPELFALSGDQEGRPGSRVPLFEPGGSLEVLDELAEREDWIRPRDPQDGAPRYHLTHGGTFTFEPGGQIEHSTAIHDTPAQAIADVDRTRAILCGAFRRRGVRCRDAGDSKNNRNQLYD